MGSLGVQSGWGRMGGVPSKIEDIVTHWGNSVMGFHSSHTVLL